MSTPALWPTNSYGTSWRSVTIWFDWSDEQIIWEAIETIDPLKVTARIRPIVIVGWDGDGWLPVHDRAEIVQNGHDTCIVVDPRPALDRTLSRIRADFGDGPWISVLGIARLDLSDSAACMAWLSALSSGTSGLGATSAATNSCSILTMAASRVDMNPIQARSRRVKPSEGQPRRCSLRRR